MREIRRERNLATDCRSKDSGGQAINSPAPATCHETRPRRYTAAEESSAVCAGACFRRRHALYPFCVGLVRRRQAKPRLESPLSRSPHSKVASGKHRGLEVDQFWAILEYSVPAIPIEKQLVAMSSITQSERTLAITTPLGVDVLLLLGFTGTESLSRFFNYQLELASTNDTISAKQIVGKAVSWSISRIDQAPRYFNGIVSGSSPGQLDQQAASHLPSRGRSLALVPDPDHRLPDLSEPVAPRRSSRPSSATSDSPISSSSSRVLTPSGSTASSTARLPSISSPG